MLRAEQAARLVLVKRRRGGLRLVPHGLALADPLDQRVFLEDLGLVVASSLRLRRFRPGRGLERAMGGAYPLLGDRP